MLIDLKPCCSPNPNYTQCKCVAVNQVRPEQIAVGALDPYVRLYDSRVMRLSKSVKELRDGAVTGCLGYFGPGNISNPRTEFDTMSRHGMPTIAITYVTFSPDGTEILANMSCEQIYVYDLTRYREALKFDYNSSGFNKVQEMFRIPASREGTYSSCFQSLVSSVVEERTLPVATASGMESGQQECDMEESVNERAKAIKDKGNVLYRSGRLTEAIEMYSRAIALDPTWHIPYSNRATAYYGRKWLACLLIHTYRIAGKFGEGFNLAIWRICGEIAKLKPRQLS